MKFNENQYIFNKSAKKNNFRINLTTMFYNMKIRIIFELT